MESNWATEHLQVIRTLMERAAIYRRALAPVMIFNGMLGLLAAIVGCGVKLESPRSFLIFWACVGIVALAGSFLLVRRQALRESEPFWSPPTRRITQALLPPIVAGCILGIVVLIDIESAPPHGLLAMFWLPLGWVVLYGCAIHAAGFFMPRGMKLFGWAFVLGGCGLFAVGIPGWASPSAYAHAIMGFFFGLLHLAYGVYLYFTEPRKNAA